MSVTTLGRPRPRNQGPQGSSSKPQGWAESHPWCAWARVTSLRSDVHRPAIGLAPRYLERGACRQPMYEPVRNPLEPPAHSPPRWRGPAAVSPAPTSAHVCNHPWKACAAGARTGTVRSNDGGKADGFADRVGENPAFVAGMDRAMVRRATATTWHRPVPELTTLYCGGRSAERRLAPEAEAMAIARQRNSPGISTDRMAP